MGRAVMVALSVLFVALPGQASPHSITRTLTIRLIWTGEQGKTLVDRKPQYQVNKGDLIQVTALLRNQVAQFGRPKGALVGNGVVLFRVMTTSEAYASLDTILVGGGLTARGRVRFGPLQTLTVTGGSGRFNHAVGSAESRALGPQGGRRLLVYRLRLR